MITDAYLENKIHELVFKHFKQLVQRREPAEPSITVIYKADSTLMRRQKRPSPFFPLLLLFITKLPHLLAFLPLPPPSVTPFDLCLSWDFTASPLFPFYSPSHRKILCCFPDKKEVTLSTKKNVFPLFPLTNQYSLRSGMQLAEMWE